ncbi:FAD-dependent oxidoreductase [Candidatus Woesearchaeota archaeon]|nr:FAD-dependent oxidoreductase [Candidatus Woesearchaeota archaeon]
MKNLVIIGGGFAGALIAKKLENKFNVTLIDSKDYFEFTPSIIKALINPKYISKIQIKHSDYLKNSKIVINKVVSLKNNLVKLQDNKKISFDYLVISSGSSYNTPFKQTDIFIPQRIEKVEDYNSKIEKSNSISIIGAGVVGIETALDMKEKYKDKTITLIHNNQDILPRQTEKTRNIVKRFLLKNKINLILNERVINYKNNKLLTNNRNKFHSDFVLIATGITPNSQFIEKKYLDDQKFIKVNEYLQFSNNIFAVGDVNNIKEEKTAQAAEKQALLTIKNLINLEKNNTLEKYVVKKRPMVISLGSKNAIFTYKNITFYGFIPAIMKKLIEFKTLFRYRNL